MYIYHDAWLNYSPSSLSPLFSRVASENGSLNHCAEAFPQLSYDLALASISVPTALSTAPCPVSEPQTPRTLGYLTSKLYQVVARNS